MMAKVKCEHSRLFISASAAFCLLLSCQTAAISKNPDHADYFAPIEARLSKSKAVNGSILQATVKIPTTLSNYEKITVEGTAGGKPLHFYLAEEEAQDRALASKLITYKALVGVPYTQAPGTFKVEVKVAQNEMGERSIPFSVRIREGQYKSEKLTVEKGKVDLPPDQLERIRQEIEETSKIYSVTTAEKYWSGVFALPVNSKYTSLYGTKRVFNGKLQSFHSGLDLRANVGRKVQATNGGKVVLAKDLFFTGNTIILDHGYGLYTVYAHLSKMDVSQGQRVKKKDLLGLAGMTGRATGPHLHWSVVLNQDKVNPAELVKTVW